MIPTVKMIDEKMNTGEMVIKLSADDSSQLHFCFEFQSIVMTPSNLEKKEF